MDVRVSAGKAAGLEACANDRGVIAAVAMDQRGFLRVMLKDALAQQGGGEATDEMMKEFKQHVAKLLTKEASSILLDVEFGLTAAKNTNGKGLLLAYEKSGYDPKFPEKLPTLTEGWSVLRLKEAGADAIKILVFYTPFEKEWVNEQKKAWVERIGAECRAMDMPLFLEFLAYDVHGEDEKGLQFAKRKPEIVRASIEEFTKERYGADVLKIEAPISLAHTAGTRAFGGEQAYTRKEALELFKTTAGLTDKPIVYLSAGVKSAAFVEMLELAAESGVAFHGVLGGRATWQDGVPVYIKDGPAALDEWLGTQGLENVRNVNRVLTAAKPWYEARSMRG